MIVIGLAAARKKDENNPRKKKGRKKLWVAFGLATLVLIASASFFLSHRWRARNDRPGVPSLPIEIPIPAEEAQKKEIQLFFSLADEESLAPESREILISGDIADQIRATVEELIRGPHSVDLLPTLPSGTALREVFLDPIEGTVYVNLSKEVVRNHPGGSQAEALTVFSLVNTLTHNFHQIRKVQILIEGQEAETLAGHILIQRPLAADPSWVRKG